MKIDSLAKQLSKKFKRQIVFKGHEMKPVSFIPFSSPKVNWLTRGGIAKGRMCEFVGAEGSGKTTSAFDIVANFQKIDDRLVVYLDAENTADLDWASKLGVNVEEVMWIKPDNEYAEMLLQMVLDLIDSGEVGLIIIDSIPFMVPKAAMEGSMEDKSYCGVSGPMTQFVGKVIGKLAKNDCTLIMINQLRDKIGSTYVAYNTPGGKALKHAYSQRLFFSKGRFLDSDCKEVTNSVEEPAGNLVEIKMEKNKVTKPDRRLGGYTLNYSIGVHVMNDTIEMAVLYNIIKQAGAWFYVIDPETGEVLKDNEGEDLRFQGKAKLLEKLEEDEELFEQIYERVNAIVLE